MTTNTKHTPGPWRITATLTSSFCIIKDDVTIADVLRNMRPSAIQSNEEVEANAKLIAAAPTMLEALQAIVSDLPFQPSPDTYKLIEAAIKKATE